jgi:hypothetical protein
MSRRDLPNALRRIHTSELANTTIEVYEPSESYDDDTGFDLTYPNSPTDTLDARVEQPSEDPRESEGGTTSDADAQVRVPDDTGIQWTDFGESGEASTKLVDTADGRRYEVQAVTDTHNGLLVLDVEEV